MRIGDIVRLKQPFRPGPNCLEEYGYGIVIGLVETDSSSRVGQASHRSEVVLQLYKPGTLTIHTDELGIQPMFYFRADELELDGLKLDELMP